MTLQAVLVISITRFVMDVSRSAHIPHTRACNRAITAQFVPLRFVHSSCFCRGEYAREYSSGYAALGERGGRVREHVALDDFQFLPSFTSSYVHSFVRSLARSRFSPSERALNFSFHLLERSHIRGFHPLERRGPFNCYPCYSHSRVFPIRLPPRAARKPADEKELGRKR